MRTVIGRFDNIDQARETVERLLEAGFKQHEINLVKLDAEDIDKLPAEGELANSTDTNPKVSSGFVESLIKLGVPNSEIQLYADELAQGHALVMITAEEIMALRAAEIIQARLSIALGSSIKLKDQVRIFGGNDDMLGIHNANITRLLNKQLATQPLEPEPINEAIDGELVLVEITEQPLNQFDAPITPTTSELMIDASLIDDYVDEEVSEYQQPIINSINTSTTPSPRPVTTQLSTPTTELETPTTARETPTAKLASATNLLEMPASNLETAKLDMSPVNSTEALEKLPETSALETAETTAAREREFYYREPIISDEVLPDDLMKLSEMSDYEVAEGAPDPRGWDLVGADNRKLGMITGLLASPSAKQAYFALVRPVHAEDELLALPLADVEFDVAGALAFVPFTEEDARKAPFFNNDASASRPDLQQHYRYWHNRRGGLQTGEKSRAAGA